jgi:hypothetical protein
MALQGLQNFKGIELSEAYLQISNFSYSMNSLLDTSIKTEAVMEADGVTLKTAAIYETKWVKKPTSEFLVKVFSNKAARDEDPYSSVYEFTFKSNVSTDVDADNFIKQSYLALKADERYKEFTDV